MDYRTLLKENFRSLEDLIEYLEISPEKRARLLQAPRFPLNLPKRLAAKIDKNNLNDPLFRQFVPLNEENEKVEGFTLDPVQDRSFVKSSRLLQKYKGRALFITTGACAMHCRYCFRQNYDYAGDKEFREEIEALRSDPTLHEVILSGGDPLSLSDRRLGALIAKLEEIPHLKILRFHTRFPIGIPERITEEFLALLGRTRLRVVFVIHCNHPRELDDEVLAALQKVQAKGALLLNQSVLLKGINDSVETLSELSLKLIASGILPYYLHDLDPVEGSAHFLVPLERALKIMEELKGEVPGYAVPKFVREIPGESSKTQISAP